MYNAIKNIIFKPIIPIIKINGMIDDKVAQLVEKSLDAARPFPIKAVAVIINSPGGSLAQCNQILQKIFRFRKQKNDIPFYTFAEEVAAAGGYYILCAGDKIFAHATSQVGCVAYSSRFSDIQIVENGKPRIKFAQSDTIWYENYDSFQTLQQQNINLIINNLQNKFIRHLKRLRKDHIQVKYFKENFFQEQQIKFIDEMQERRVLSQNVILGSEAIQCGMIDGLGTFQSVLYNDFPDIKLDFISDTIAREMISKEKI